MAAPEADPGAPSASTAVPATARSGDASREVSPETRAQQAWLHEQAQDRHARRRAARTADNPYARWVFRTNLAEAYAIRNDAVEVWDAGKHESADKAAAYCAALAGLVPFSRVRTRLAAFVDGARVDDDTRQQLAVFVQPVTPLAWPYPAAFKEDEENVLRQTDLDVAVALARVNRDDERFKSYATSTAVAMTIEWCGRLWPWEPTTHEVVGGVPLALAVALVHALVMSGFAWYAADDWARAFGILLHNVQRAGIAPKSEDAGELREFAECMNILRESVREMEGLHAVPADAG